MDITEKYKWHHTALFRGYVSRKSSGYIQPYTGKYGTGYKVFKPNYNSTRYSFVEYWIQEAEK
jgi:hypothetical protein